MTFLSDTMPVTCEDCGAPAEVLSVFGHSSPVCKPCEQVRKTEFEKWTASVAGVA